MKSLGIIVAKVVAIGLLLGALGRHKYDYYTILRWIVCAVSAFAAFRAAEGRKYGWVCVLAVVAVVFNPIVPVHLKRETWAFIDIAAAALLLISIIIVDRDSKSGKP